MSDFDAIVVGSGAGGLSAGLAIAQQGRSVLILEAARVAGGCLAPLRKDGYSFDVGVHYLGQLAEGEPFWQALDELGLAERVELIELPEDSIDRYVFPDFECHLCKGRERFREQLLDLFPAERAGVDRFFTLFDRVARASESFMVLEGGRWRTLGWLARNPVMLKYGRVPYQTLLDAVTSDVRLQAVLAAPWVDYMLPPKRASVTYGIGVLDHYLGGAYYPRGGSGRLRDTFVQAFEEQGGELRTAHRVSRIDRQAGELVVTAAEGESWTAKVVVSDVDPRVTLGELVCSELVPATVLRKARELRPSASVLGVFVGTDLDLPTLGLGAGNLFHYAGYDINQIFDAAMAPESPEVTGCLFVNSPTIRDPDGNLAPAGRHGFEILVAVSYGAFERHCGTPVEPSDDHQAFVRELGGEVITAMEQYVPALSQHLEFVEYLSPLDFEHRLGMVRGGIYGPELSPDQMGSGRFADGTCGVDGLFLAGAGVRGSGVRYCVSSGIQAGRRAVSYLEGRAR